MTPSSTFGASPNFVNGITSFAVASTQSPYNTSLVQIVGRHFHFDPIPRGHADESFPHLARDVRQHLMLVGQLDPKHGVRQDRQNRSFHFDQIFHLYFLFTDLPSLVSRESKDRSLSPQQINRLNECKSRRWTGKRHARRAMTREPASYAWPADSRFKRTFFRCPNPTSFCRRSSHRRKVSDLRLAKSVTGLTCWKSGSALWQRSRL